MPKRGNPLVSFIAGFGTGYLNSEKAKKDQERQDKLDQITFDEAARRKQEYDANKAVEDKVSALPNETYAKKTALSTDDVRNMMGGSSDPTADNYIPDEAAQHYINNNTGAAQVNANAASIAQQGVGDNLNGMKAVANQNGGVDIADPSSATAIPVYKKLEQAANIRIGSGNPQQEALGYQALAHATALKADAMKQGLAKANAEGGATKMLEFMHNWDNEDFPVTNLRLEQPSNGYDPKNPNGSMYNVIGTVNGKEQVIRSYDPKQIPQGMSIDDVILHDATALIDPAKMYDQKMQMIAMQRQDERNKVTDARADKAESRADELQPYAVKNAQSTSTINAAKAGVASQEASLGLTKTQAEINKLNADADKERKSKDGIDLAASKELGETSNRVAQGVAAELERKGIWKPVDGKTKIQSKVINPDTQQIEANGLPKYVVGNQLQKDAQALIKAGIPEADAISMLSDRKTQDGKSYVYSKAVEYNGQKGFLVNGGKGFVAIPSLNENK